MGNSRFVTQSFPSSGLSLSSPAYSSQSAGVFFEMIQIMFRSVCLINGRIFSPRMFNKSSDILPQTLFDMWEAPELARKENRELFLSIKILRDYQIRY